MKRMSASNPRRTSFNYSGYRAVINKKAGVYPYFVTMVRSRMRDKLANNLVVSGEAGVSKTYTAAMIAKLLNRRWNPATDLVMNYDEYMTEIMRRGKKNVPIVFDEPQDALYNRDWQKDINKALVKTMTSQRFRLRPVIIPIINQNLLDINIRKYLLQFHVVMLRRGEGLAYRLTSSQVEDKLYRERICKIQYGMMDVNRCHKDSCLSCKTLTRKTPEGEYECTIWRAIYERKKIDEVNKRDAKSVEDQRLKNVKKLTKKDLIAGTTKADVQKMTEIINGKTRINLSLLGDHFDETFGVTLGENKLRGIRTSLEQKYLTPA
jgi:hypothetical protein